MDNTFIEVKSNGVVKAKQGSNKRTPYDHQKRAMENLDIIDETPSYSTLVVLPTGGGKTYTASLWLLKHALNRHKKTIAEVIKDKKCNEVGRFQCKGFDTYGPFKLFGGIQKGHPDETELKAAVDFYKGITGA